MQIACGTASGPRHVGRVLQNLARAQKPLIAAVNGLSVGVGATMLLHCDLVYITASAKLTTPFVGLGLVPEAASSLLLPQALGAKRAYAMFALGEAITGAEAVTFGLANRAFDTAAEARDAARAAAQALVNRPPQALAHTKALMRDGEALGALMLKEGALFEQQLRSEDAREAFTAFMERRPTRFAPGCAIRPQPPGALAQPHPTNAWRRDRRRWWSRPCQTAPRSPPGPRAGRLCPSMPAAPPRR